MATVGNVNMTQIDARVRARLSNFAGPRATIAIATESTYDFASVRRAEKLLIDTAPLGAYNNGDCWEEVTGNTTRDDNRGRNGQGGADDIVRYEVTMTYPRIVPIGRFIGWSDTETIVANTVLRNQPYAGRAINVHGCNINGTARHGCSEHVERRRSSLARGSRRVSRGAPALRDCTSGLALIEFAMSLPVLLMLGLLGLETANYAMAHLRDQQHRDDHRRQCGADPRRHRRSRRDRSAHRREGDRRRA